MKEAGDHVPVSYSIFHLDVVFASKAFAMLRFIGVTLCVGHLTGRLKAILRVKQIFFDKIEIFNSRSYKELRLTHLFSHLKSGTLKSIPYVSCVGDS